MEKTNPFYRGGSIRDPRFFWGRTDQVSEALDLLSPSKRLCISVLGPPGIGKSSFLLHVSNPEVYRGYGLIPEQVCFVYLDCQGEEWSCGEPELLYALLHEKIAVALTRSGHAIRLVDHTAESTGNTYLNFRRSLSSIRAQGIQLVLLLDEFEALASNPKLDKPFYDSLRALAGDNLSYVIASKTPLLQLTYAQASTITSDFFNIFIPIRLGLFSDTEAHELLRGLAARGGIAFAQSTLDFLSDLAGPHPLLLQIAGYHAVDLSPASGHAFDSAGLANLQRRFVSESEDHWTYAWQHLTPADQRCLAVLPAVWPSNLQAVARLTQAALVRHQHGGVVYLSAAFQRFVSQQRVPGLLQVPPITMDVEQHITLRRGRLAKLTPTAFRLLAHLLSHSNKIVSYSDLDKAVWPDDHHVENTLDSARLRQTIKTLRRALEEDGGCIEAVKGIGYRFSRSG